MKKIFQDGTLGIISRRILLLSAFFFCIIRFSLPTVSALIVPTAPSNQGLVLYWRLDEGATNKTRDYSGNNLTGTLTNMADPATVTSGWTTSGKIGGGVVFDGSNDAVTVPDNDKIDIRTGSMTWSIWFQTATTSRGIMYRKSDGANANGVILEISSGNVGKTDCFIHNGGIVPSIISPTTYNDGKWHHMVCVLDRNAVVGSLYMDGVLVATSSLSGIVGLDMNATQPAGLSSLPFFEGKLDDFRIYNRALLASEIAGLARAGVFTETPSNNNLIGYWKFDEGAGIKARDVSGNGNTGTLSNFANPATATSGWATSGKIGGALNFIGQGLATSTIITVPTSAAMQQISSDLTLSAWVYVRNFDGSTGMITRIGAGATLRGCIAITATNQFLFQSFSGTFDTVSTATGVIPMNTWVHVTAIRSGTLVSLYVNGVLRATSTSPLPTVVPSGAVTIGASSVTSQVFNGMLDEVHIYNRALSASEVSQLYRGPAAVGSSNPNSVTTGGGNGLVGHWTFDGKTLTNATATDSSGNGNAGTLNGSPKATIGKVGQGMTFNGTSQYVQVPYSSSLAPTTSALSFGAWFKATDKSGGKRIISKTQTGGYNLAFNDIATNTISTVIFLPNTGGYRTIQYSLDNIKLNTWYHAFTTYDGSQIRFYINGNQVAITTGSGPVGYSASNTLCIGNEAGSIGCTDATFFGGSIDDVRVYNRWLSPTEVQGLYKLGGR